MIQDYFNACVSFWMSRGDSKGIATIKALWWDCVEVWNADKSWNDEKIVFVNQYRKYKPYGPIPEAECTAAGNA